MGKLIIIEGVDGSGKTTLIEGLKREIWPDLIFNYSNPIGSTVFQQSSYAEGEYAASIRIFKQLLYRSKMIVCDRFHLGEYAYGPVMRGYPKWLAAAIMDNTEDLMIKLLDLRKVYLIVLFTNPFTAASRIKLEDEYPNSKKDLFDIDKRYMEAINRTEIKKKLGIATCSPNYDGHEDKLLEEAIKFIVDL